MRQEADDIPRSSNFERLVFSCRTHGGVDVLDLPRGVMTPEQLRNTSPRCSECGGSRDLNLAVTDAGPGKKDPRMVSEGRKKGGLYRQAKARSLSPSISGNLSSPDRDDRCGGQC